MKDASTTAIYGSRGANGVVLITTKHGKEGKIKINAKAVSYTHLDVYKRQSLTRVLLKVPFHLNK